MPNRERRRRAGKARVQGRARARYVAARLGTALREARLAVRMTQAQVALAAGVSQGWISELERGQGTTASIESWAAIAAAVDDELAAFLQRAAGADRPRDHEHLRRQQLVIERALGGGWRAIPEAPIDLDRLRSRSVDILLTRAVRLEAAVVEVWDFVADGGEAMRGLDAKVAALDRHLNVGRDLTAGSWRVGGLWVVRGTRRNRITIDEFRAVFAAKFPSSGADWLGALATVDHPMPEGHGFLWTDVKGSTLTGARLSRR